MVSSSTLREPASLASPQLIFQPFLSKIQLWPDQEDSLKHSNRTDSLIPPAERPLGATTTPSPRPKTAPTSRVSSGRCRRSADASAPMRRFHGRRGTCPTSTRTRCSSSTTSWTSSSSTKPSSGATSFCLGRRRTRCISYVAIFCAFLNCFARFARFARFAHYLANTAYPLSLTYRHGTCGNSIARSVRESRGVALAVIF